MLLRERLHFNILKCFNLFINAPSWELEVLVEEEVVDETEDHLGVGEVPGMGRYKVFIHHLIIGNGEYT